MVILDLEWNRGYDNKLLGDILQIGAVRVEYLRGPVADTFNAYIGPTVHRRFDLGAKQLPDLRMSQESELDFVTVLEMFRTWCGAETEYAAWGNDDLATLTQNCEQRKNGAGQGGGCWRADARQRRQRRPTPFWPPNFTDFQVCRL